MTQPTYTGPAHPIGYVEASTKWMGTLSPEELSAEVQALRTKMQAENPACAFYSSHIAHAFDGDGVLHHTLTMGFAPVHVAAEPLNARNMNDAPVAAPGMIQPEDGITPLGYREQQFGRGTD